MANKPAKRAPKVRPTIVVYGNAQARAVHHVFESMPVLVERFDLRYVDSSAVARKDAPECTVLFDQQPDLAGGATPASPSKAKIVRFPIVAFNLLWPFNCPNPLNAPHPPAYPFGPFPNGDSFLLSCVKQHVLPKDAIALYLGTAWPSSWPDLDKLFRQESARLIAVDAASDVQIGSYILKHFRKRRLFVAPLTPADILLSELITRMLAAAFSGDSAIADCDLPGVIGSFGYRDYLGVFALPVHPLVARHFQLEWFEPNARYNYFDREQLTGKAYYERFIAYALERHGS